jgi:hypothetical protein
MFIAGAIYWSGLGNEATRHAQSIGSSAVLKDVTRDVDSAVQ